MAFSSPLVQVGPLKKGLNPISIQYLNFQSEYVVTSLKAGIFTGTLALAVRTLTPMDGFFYFFFIAIGNLWILFMLFS